MISIRPPTNLDYATISRKFSIFFGGTIDMGVSEDWQSKLENDLKHHDNDLVLYIPRRLDWDSSGPQDPTPGTQFNYQVNWEFYYQDHSSLNVYYFADGSMSPITLLELGCFGSESPSNTVVCCSPKYFRYGNVAMFCKRYNIKLVETYEDLLNFINNKIEEEFFHG